MSTRKAIPQLYYSGNAMDMSENMVGDLRVSTEALGDRAELHQRFAADGYLYLPGYLDRDDVEAARMALLRKLSADGALDERYGIAEAVLKPGKVFSFEPNLAEDNRFLDKVLYSGRMMEFYGFFLGGKATHFDHTWFRAKSPGFATATSPHCDIVFMGRGTHNLYTSWVPFSDVPYEMGGLMLLEGSHFNEELRSGYCQRDVDAYCENVPGAAEIVASLRAEQREPTQEERDVISPTWGGQLSKDAITLQRELTGRWLTAEYSLGDLLVFCMHIVHASSDNQTDRVRLSSDSRYQLASEPQDQRWMGDDPPKHGIRAKQGMIC